MFDFLREDLRRCGSSPHRQLRELILVPSTWAVVGYRFRCRVRRSRLPRLLRLPLNLAAALSQTWTEAATNIELPGTARIGPGLSLPHTGYIVVSSDAVLGSHCTLTQGVTIGHAGGGTRSVHGSPVIGDRVYVGPGAAIIGPITIGDDVLVGAGAVVTASVPPRAVVAGNPARVLSYRGSFDLIDYPGMDADAARLRSLALRDTPQSAEPKLRQPNAVQEDHHADPLGCYAIIQTSVR